MEGFKKSIRDACKMMAKKTTSSTAGTGGGAGAALDNVPRLVGKDCRSIFYNPEIKFWLTWSSKEPVASS